MIRRFNYTRRARIPTESLQIVLHESPSSPSRFEMAVSLPDTVANSPHAAVWVEAYAGSVQMRFRFGHASAPVPPESTVLDRFRPGEKVLFRVKVVDESDDLRRILAWADKIRPVLPEEAVSGRKSILPVERAELGERLWRLEWREEMPILQVNESVTQPRAITQMARMDPEFLSLVYPAVIREILHTLTLTNQVIQPDEEADHDWLSFACAQLGAGPLPPEPEEDGSGAESRLRWIDDAVDGFCRRWKTLEAFVAMKRREANA
jgi:hypothetical protein